MPEMRKKYIILTVAPLVAVVDQISKFWITRSFYLFESVPVVKNIFHITYVTNTGSAFSMFSGYGGWLMLMVAAVLALIYVYVSSRADAMPAGSIVAFALILGGGTGNLIDRIVRGSVVDFLDFRVFPVFNIADTAITCGISLLVLTSIIKKNR